MKAKAARIISEAGIEPGWVPDYAKADSALWTHRTVRDALVDASRYLAQHGGRVGPGRMRAAWPDHVRDYYDDEQHRRDADRRKGAYSTAMNMTRAEMVLFGWKDSDGVLQAPWLDGPLLQAPELRELLRDWIKAELRGETFKELCRRRLWVYTTAATHRDRAAGIIAQRLNAAKIEPF